VPRIHVDPDVIFLIVLPPLLYIAGYFTPVRSLRENLGTISSLAVGLVIVSAGAVAAVAHALVPGMPWSAAFALGAIVAPPDAIAATAITRRLAVPRQIVTILEGESLLNDATALTIYGIALAVAAGSVFSPTTAVAMFTAAMLGGCVIGVAVGWIVAHIRARLEDTPVEMTISLLTPYAAFLPADRLDASGVIATVAAGLYLGHRGSHIMGADARLTGRAVWETMTFLLNGFVFIVMGLEVPPLLRALTPSLAIQLVGIGVAVTVALILVRALWIFGTVFLPQYILGRPDAFAYSLVLSWAGMRGVVSLAAALALPLTLPAGRPFPARDALVVVTLTVIVLTLLGQGLTLPWLIRALRLGRDTGVREEEARARRRLLEAATRRIDELYPVWPGHHPCSISFATRTGTAPSTSNASGIHPLARGKIASSSSTARSGERSSTPSARRCCVCVPRARSTRKCCATSSVSSTSRSAEWMRDGPCERSGLSADSIPLPMARCSGGWESRAREGGRLVVYLTKSGPAKLWGQFAGRRTVFDAKRMCSLDAISRRLITTHMPRNDAAARGHVCPGIRITAQLVLSLDPAADLDRAQLVYDAHLARARWMTCRLSSLLK
jgi:CPA1 family monovalent cation:H+ antiporter